MARMYSDPGRYEGLPDDDFRDSGYEPDDVDEDGFPLQFANQGSALRAAGPGNPRNLPCPTCKRENVLTPADRSRGYQCDTCADNTERFGGPYGL